jgi:hypothetical protein
MYRIHPYDELIIKQKLNPAPRHRVFPIVTEPLRCREGVSAALRRATGAIGNLFGRGESAECCPAGC